MPTVTLTRLLRDLDSRPVSAAFFLEGEEEHLREEAVAAILGRVLDDATRDFNFDQLRGGDVTPEGLGSILATPPMMAEHRVVLIREMQGLSPKAREIVEKTATDTPPGLMLIVSGQRPSGSQARFYKQMEKVARTITFPRMGLNDLPGWMTDRAREAHGLEIDIDAAQALVTAIGSHLGVLATELEKLAAFAGERGTITLEDVRAIGGYVPRVDRWKWFDLIATRQFEKALSELPELLESGESAVGLVIGMGGQLVRVAIAVAGGREALEKSLPANQRWLARNVGAASRHWSLDEIDEALSELYRTDRLLKTAPLTDRQAMEELLLRLAAARPESRSVA